MEIPPPISPTPATPINPVLSADDEKLLKRASHAGRNLFVLATLASVGALVLICVTLFAKPTTGVTTVMTILGATIAIIAAGYWVLAVAARRGNPNAVGIVIVMMVIQMALAFIFAGITAARTNTPFQPPVGGLLIPIIVLIALISSRKVLLHLKERNLWEQVFGSAKPSGNLCVTGGVLLAIGFIGMNVGTTYIGWKASQEKTVEMQHANAFVQLVKVDEQDFISAMKLVYTNGGQQDIETAQTKFNTLEQHLENLKKDSADNAKLLQILSTYSGALRQWKNGMDLVKGPNPELDRAQKMFKLGDRLRADACNEFDRIYAAKKPQPGN